MCAPHGWADEPDHPPRDQVAEAVRFRTDEFAHLVIVGVRRGVVGVEHEHDVVSAFGIFFLIATMTLSAKAPLS